MIASAVAVKTDHAGLLLSTCVGLKQQCQDYGGPPNLGLWCARCNPRTPTGPTLTSLILRQNAMQIQPTDLLADSVPGQLHQS